MAPTTVCGPSAPQTRGVFLGTANPYYGTQLWRLYSERDQKICKGEEDCPSRAFADLNPAVWYHPYTDYVISHGLMKGMDATTFGPYKSMTRAMMVTTLYRLAGEPQGNGASPSRMWRTIRTMPKQWPGLQPTALPRASRLIPSPRTPPVTREQAAAFVYRYVTGYLGKTPVPGASLPVFLDADQVSPYAEEALAWAHAAGLMVGYGDGYMGPEKPVTRYKWPNFDAAGSKILSV